MNCPNCGAKLSCGCQQKTAFDGKQGCTQCIPAYEKKLQEKKSTRQDDQQLTIDQQLRLTNAAKVHLTLQ